MCGFSGLATVPPSRNFAGVAVLSGIRRRLGKIFQAVLRTTDFATRIVVIHNDDNLRIPNSAACSIHAKSTVPWRPAGDGVVTKTTPTGPSISLRRGP